MISEILGALCVAIWCYLLLGRGAFWRVRELKPPPQSSAYPNGGVAVVVPARNEALVVGEAIRSLASQDYAGPLHIFLVDDECSDDTAATAQQAATGAREPCPLTVIKVGPRPAGWTGKLWAVSEGVRHARELHPAYYLFTDADIVHASDSITGLVSRADAGPYDLVSLMVELHCQTFAERALIPTFVFFFFMLYPPAWVNDPSRRTAAAAGGCILIRSDALDKVGGIAAIRGQLIDDCALAAAVKRAGGRLWLGPSRNVRSIREYQTGHDIARMISRNAFTQLRHSTLLLALTISGMLVTFILPIVLSFQGHVGSVLGVASWTLMSLAFVPMLRLYRRSLWFAPVLPFMALFYAGATVDSAIQYWRGMGGLWKGRVQDPERRAAS